VITFKSTEDLSKLSPSDPALSTVRTLVHDLITAYTEPGQIYDWEAYGFVILIEESDVNRELNELWDGATLMNIPWENFAKEKEDVLVGITILNNSFGLAVVFPNADWVTGELREMIEDILDPPTSEDTQEIVHD